MNQLLNALNHVTARSGFRLQRLEVYNWGTFHGRVWALEPGGSTALLTGANGSGKSTLVDGLLTLLVPNRQRSYNQASGTALKRERDEKSYVRGAYGRAKDESNPKGSVQYLRDKNDYSVLLAAFRNERLRQELTVAQVFYWGRDDLQKLHVVAPCTLTILEHFRVGSGIAELKQRLKALGAELYDEFARYHRQIIKQFGLRSEKAFDLFNQTVALKEIGGLNDFVRQHMLEKTDAQEKIAQLRANYENLTRAHDAIEKAEAQLQRLRPMLAEADQYQTLQGRITEAERCADTAPFFFASRKLSLLDKASADTRQNLSRLKASADTLATRLDGLRNQDRELHAAITNDSVGQQLENLRREAERVQERMGTRRSAATRYDKLATSLKLPPVGDEASFYANRKKVNDAFPQIEQRLQKLTAERDSHKQAEGQLLAKAKALHDEIASLQQRKNRIPAENVRIRAELAQALGLTEDAMPFVGELLRVRDDSRQWEPAIERLLGGYGRQLLVPEEHYRRVSGYVDGANLRGRLIYQRVGERRNAPGTGNLDPQALVFKLDVKPGHPLHNWLKADLIEHWDYVCCESMSEFQRERRALSLNGQVKSSTARHEKDDRFALGDRTRYVLGWDNRDKIAALQEDLAAVARELAASQAAISQSEQEARKLNESKQTLRDLLNFETFADVNWFADEAALAELQSRQQALEASSNSLQQLQQQREEVTNQIHEAEREQAQVQALIGTCQSDLQRYEKQRSSSETLLQTARAEAWQSYAARIEADLKGRTVTLENVDETQSALKDGYTRSANALKGQANGLREGIVVKMTNFRRDYPADTADMDAAIEALPVYRQLCQRIERDDLPTYRQRFKEWLNGKVTESIVGFKSDLDIHETEIRESIDTLNTSLRLIDYTPTTYIRLRADASRDREIVEFRQALRACIPDVGQRSPDANESSFQRIRALIQRFEQEDRWTAKVTDVRQWLDFSAEERYREDDKEKNFYSDSSGKSGGQKAKLAYTILASAIAYQYGLDQEENQERAFRFVVVDEAFSKSDEQNARYAMNLFEQLNLQLLVVTPLDKTHVVEPFIAACHFVSNNADENDSKVYNLTFQQYQEQKASFAALAAVEEE